MSEEQLEIKVITNDRPSSEPHDFLQLCSELESSSCSARFSPDRQYRYELWRRWGAGEYCLFVGLNPSTADETKDDPTIRRCINFAKAWGYGALCMANLFAYRATDPADMKREPEPNGPENDDTLKRLAAGAGVVIAAWGVHGTHHGRNAEVMAMLPNLDCLGVTKDGHPKHPLYLPKTVKPEPLNTTNQSPDQG